MDFAYSVEQDDFRASVRRFLTDHCPSERMRAADGFDGALWQRLCGELGCSGLHVPEEFGGGGFTVVETALVQEELGRALAPVPALGTAFAGEAILRLGTHEQRKEWLPGLLSGERVGAVALAGAHDTDPAAATVHGAGSATARTLTGERPVVLHGHVADLVVVPAVVADAVVLHVVETAADGVTTVRLPSLDPTRPAATLRLRDAPASVLDASAEQLDDLLDVLRVLLAAELLGTAGACLDATVGYAGQRVQFNRPIGSFQAVKHRCAEMAVELDATTAAVMFAALAAADGSAELPVAAVLAKAQAADTAVLCAAAAIQLHGGIGFTWEHDAHLHYRRALSGAALLGSSTWHRELLAERTGIAPHCVSNQ